MRQLLCYGDSNTWGLIPGTHDRYPYEVRWTGILQEKLSEYDIRVVEEGLCGRTTVFDDAYRENRNGLKTLPFVLETHSPLYGAVIMLGTNDCKTHFNVNAYQIRKGLEKCVDTLLKVLPADKILVVSPIHLGPDVWKAEFDPEFNQRSVETSKQMHHEYEILAKQKGLRILAASEYAEPSATDQEHLTREGHKALAQAIFNELAL